MNWITPYFSKLFLVKILSSRKGYWCVTRDGTETCPASPRACPCPLGHCHLCPPRLHLLGKSKFWPLFFSRRFYSYWIQPTISSPHPWQWRATDTVSRVISVHHPWRAGHVCFSPVNAEPAPALARTVTYWPLVFPPLPSIIRGPLWLWQLQREVGPRGSTAPLPFILTPLSTRTKTSTPFPLDSSSERRPSL